jgi:hypothetical protein
MVLPALSPIVSECETDEQVASHDRWFRAKVEASLADARPGVPHAEVKARTACRERPARQAGVPMMRGCAATSRRAFLPVSWFFITERDQNVY